MLLHNVVFVKIFPNKTLSNGLFLRLWHFSTQNARKWLKSNCT